MAFANHGASKARTPSPQSPNDPVPAVPTTPECPPTPVPRLSRTDSVGREVIAKQMLPQAEE